MALLSSVPYGRAGPWALNIWAKLGDQWGTDLGYIYNHWSSAGAIAFKADPANTWFPNQVRLPDPSSFETLKPGSSKALNPPFEALSFRGFDRRSMV